jgi:hypothetical protein
MHPTLGPCMDLDHAYLTRFFFPKSCVWFVPSFSSKTTKEAVGKSQATRLTGPISPACDWYVQYLLVEANPSVLNRHRRGLQPPKGPTQAQVIQSQHSLKWKWCETYCQPVVFWPLSAYRGLYLHLAMANVIQIPAMSSRVTRKVFIVQLRFQSTPINLMHNHS